MNTDKTCETVGQSALRRYETFGLLGGLALGLLIGVMFSGPHFHEWSVSLSLMVIFGCAAGGAVIGYLALAIAVGSFAGGGASGAGYPDSAGYSDGGGDGGADCGGSGSGDGGSACD